MLVRLAAAAVDPKVVERDPAQGVDAQRGRFKVCCTQRLALLHKVARADEDVAAIDRELVQQELVRLREVAHEEIRLMRKKRIRLLPSLRGCGSSLLLERLQDADGPHRTTARQRVAPGPIGGKRPTGEG